MADTPPPTEGTALVPAILPSAAPSPPPTTPLPAPLTTTNPTRQLAEIPRDELQNLAEELGLDATTYKTRQLLVAAIHQRRQLIATLDREAMLDVIRWGRRPVTINASKEQIAQEIARIRSMRFVGLSHRGVVALACLRGIDCNDKDEIPGLIRRLKKQEGFFTRISRKRRSMLGAFVAKIVGENETSHDYRFLPPPPGAASGSAMDSAQAASASIKEEIEHSGLLGGITNRIKKSADQYLNQKLDEIEARIDRKLDEIDRRLTEWRDKEIANRIRILKITLWASVIVGIFSLIYAYVTTYFSPK
ncbi:MAG: hypothetical protein M3O30_09675 [Planctomycetota bacterium]|nr:hypothetical protein [Planctomycetota bacterium]